MVLEILKLSILTFNLPFIEIRSGRVQLLILLPSIKHSRSQQWNEIKNPKGTILWYHRGTMEMVKMKPGEIARTSRGE